jgi:GTP:adenosylcobinamide-phosphate guanylyltransferase
MADPVQFELRTTKVTEFGVGIDDAEGPRFVLVPVDDEVQAALREMVAATRSAMKEVDAKPTRYQPSEKHAAHENLHLPLNDGLAAGIRKIHQANNLNSDPAVLRDPKNVFCYFARLSDGQGQHLTAIRRASTFKGVLESRLVSFVNDALKLVEDKVFKLDQDFDFLVDSAGVHILRPSGFEFVGDLREAIMKAAPTNIKAVQADLSFVDFGPIQTYAMKHPRAARYLASIRLQETKNIDKSYLKKLCNSTGVSISEVHGQLVVDENSIMDFLGVLDRRLYWLELIKGSPEPFRAASRSKIVKAAVVAGSNP